jgi:lipopolysaccharide export system permease protein
VSGARIGFHHRFDKSRYRRPGAAAVGAPPPLGYSPATPKEHTVRMRQPRGRSAKSPTRIDLYMFRQLLIALVAVSGGLVALIWLTQSLRFVELVVNRGLTFWVFLELTSLLIPSLLAVILPITTYMVVQFVYLRLAGDRELTVMRAAGLSPLMLARPALALAALSMLVCFVLNIYIVPHSLAESREFQFEIRNRIVAFLLQEGVFTPVSEDLTVYVRKRDTDGTLHGILVDDARQPNSHATILAERGRLVETGDVPRVRLINGSRQELDRQTGRLDVLTFAENTIDLAQPGKGEETRLRDPSEMSMGELLSPSPGLLGERDIGKAEVEAHRRLSSPFTALSFTLVALVAVLTGSFRRHGGLLRPAASVLALVTLLALGLAFGHLASRDTRLIPLIWAQAILPGVVAAWVLFSPHLRPGPGTLLQRVRAT